MLARSLGHIIIWPKIWTKIQITRFGIVETSEKKSELWELLKKIGIVGTYLELCQFCQFWPILTNFSDIL
jgi:hypothetical protein